MSLIYQKNTMHIFYSILVLFTAGLFSISGAFAEEIDDLDYEISGAKVTGFELDSTDNSLTISLDVRARGEITVILPRDLIDAKQDSEDVPFEIRTGFRTVDSYDETITLRDRTVTIPFTRSTYDVTIFGTQVYQSSTNPKSAQSIDEMIKTELNSNILNDDAKLLIYSNTDWTAALQSSTFDYLEISGQGNDSMVFDCTSTLNRSGVFGAKINKITQDGFVHIVVIQNHEILSQGMTDEEFGDVLINGNCFTDNAIDSIGGGGCLIATATYGSEMATQVQQLREIRDNQLLNTEAGKSFVNSFNHIYYSFSPYIADYERENPVFQEMVKLAITPMISSLSIMSMAESDSEVLGFGISLILLNVAMYVGIPVVAIIGIKKKF